MSSMCFLLPLQGVSVSIMSIFTCIGVLLSASNYLFLWVDRAHVEILVEVLKIFGTATKELKWGSAKKFLRKLAGWADLEDSLKRLDKLMQEEARMVHAEVLRIMHNIQEEVKIVDGKVERVDDKVEEVGDKVEDVGDKVQWVDDKVQAVIEDSKQARVVVKDIGDKVADIGDTLEGVGDKVEEVGDKVEDIGDQVQCVDGKVQVVIDGVRDGKQARAAAQETRLVIQQVANDIDEINSSVIQDLMAVCETGSAIMAFFYFDFKDLRKQTCHDLLLSLVSELSARSTPCCGILHHVYEVHENGSQQPGDDTLKECLKQMLKLPVQRPIFIVLDALDECPDTSGLPPPHSEVLQLVKELIDLQLPGLYICATSRPEVDIRAVHQPLAFRSVSLHDESRKKTDITKYVCSVVNLSLSTAMRDGGRTIRIW
ncbi:hypothetical protein V8E53_002901 [Lactarius tabidus]